MTIAAVNSPASTVISGPPGQVAAVVAAARDQGLRTRIIDVDYASHGPQVGQIAAALAAVPARHHPRTRRRPVLLRRHRPPHRRHRPGRRLLDRPASASPSASPTPSPPCSPTGTRSSSKPAPTPCSPPPSRRPPTPAPHIPAPHPPAPHSAGAGAAHADAIPTLRRDHGGLAQIARAAARAFTSGVTVDWTRWYPANPPPHTVDLPTYPFQRQRFPASDGRCAADPVSLGLAAVGHPVLGAAVESADTGELLLTGRVSRQALPWLADHEVSGHQLVPGAALVEWALRAADEAGCAAVEELVLHTSTVLPRDGGLTVQLAVGTPGGDGRRELRVYSRFGEHGLRAFW